MAAKKPFRLRTVLRYKQQREKRLQGELAHLSQQLVAAEAQRVRLQQQQEHCLHALRQREQAGLAAAELLTYSAFLQQLSGEMSQQAQAIADLHAAVEQARARLEQAMKDRKVIENLQEKAHLTQKKQTLRDEERTLAEIALRRFTG
jgi:flagellar FliJ protein